MGRESWGGDTLETLIGSRETIIGYAAGRVGFDEAEDIAQDVALGALEASNKKVFSSGKHYRNWLFTITRNRCISVLRKKVNFGFPINEKDTADPEPGPERQYLSEESLRELTLRLELLTPKQRAVISLHYIQDLDYKEVGTILGMSENSARQRSFQGIAILRRNLPQDVDQG